MIFLFVFLFLCLSLNISMLMLTLIETGMINVEDLHEFGTKSLLFELLMIMEEKANLFSQNKPSRFVHRVDEQEFDRFIVS